MIVSFSDELQVFLLHDLTEKVSCIDVIIITFLVMILISYSCAIMQTGGTVGSSVFAVSHSEVCVCCLQIICKQHTQPLKSWLSLHLMER